LEDDSDLSVGQTLNVPILVATDQDNASTSTVYNANQAEGNTSPTHPPKPNHNGCGVVGEIILAVIAVAVAVATAGAATAAISAAMTGAETVGTGALAAASAIGTVATGAGAAAAGGLSLAAVAGGVIGGIAGSVVSQGVGLATGLQSKFSWSQLGMAAISGGVGGAIGPSGLDAFSGLSGDIGTFGVGVLQGATESLVSQGLDVATGMQSKFDWAGAAAAGLGNGVLNEVKANLGPNIPPNSTGAVFIGGMAGMIVNAATRTLITGTDFGDNILKALPDVIGETIGNAVATETENEGSLGKAGATDEDQPDFGPAYDARMSDADEQPFVPPPGSNDGQFTPFNITPLTFNPSQIPLPNVTFDDGTGATPVEVQPLPPTSGTSVGSPPSIAPLSNPLGAAVASTQTEPGSDTPIEVVEVDAKRLPPIDGSLASILAYDSDVRSWVRKVQANLPGHPELLGQYQKDFAVLYGQGMQARWMLPGGLTPDNQRYLDGALTDLVGNTRSALFPPTGGTYGISLEGSGSLFGLVSGNISVGIVWDTHGNTAFQLTLSGGGVIDNNTLMRLQDAWNTAAAEAADQGGTAVGQGFLSSFFRRVGGTSFSGQLSVGVSDADTVDDLQQAFEYNSYQVGDEIGGGVTTFSGTSVVTGKAVSGTIYSAGVVTGVSYSHQYGYTWIWHL
jgi:hypothetical protein